MRRSFQTPRKKSDQPSCPVGFVTYPDSIEDELKDSENHVGFGSQFGLFLKVYKDGNVRNPQHEYYGKYEQRYVFASQIAKTHLEPKRMVAILAAVGGNFMSEGEWVDDLLEGFDGAQTLINHLKDLYSNSDSSIAVKEELVASAYSWVVDQLDVEVQEFKRFREGLHEKEREKWDKLVDRYEVKLIDQYKEKLREATHKQDTIGIELVNILEKMAEIISRHKNQGLDIDALLESIEGPAPSASGAIPKKPKDKIKKKKNHGTKGKDGQANAESLAQGNGSSQDLKSHQEKENAFHGKKTLADEPEIVNVTLKTKETVSASTEIAGDLAKPKQSVENRKGCEKIEKVVFESTRIVDELRNAKETGFGSTKISDELRKTSEELNITKAQLDETKTRLKAEEVKNSRLNDKLTSAYHEIDILRTKILTQDQSDETKNRLREEELKNAQLNTKLTSAYKDIRLLRSSLARQVNGSGVIHHEKEQGLIQNDDSRSFSRPGVGSSFSYHENDGSFIRKDASRSFSHQGSGPSSSHEEKPSLTRKGDLSDFSLQGSGLGLCRQGANSSYSSQGPDSDVPRSLQKAGPFEDSLSNGATASPYPPGGVTTSFQQAGATASFSSQTGATASFSSQTGATASFSPQTGATASFSPQTGATASPSSQTGAATSSLLPTRAEKLPNTRKAKKATSLMKGSGVDASLTVKDDDCTICFEEMYESDSLHLSNCWHRFHRECINQWMESPGEGREAASRSTCPICRTDIDEDDKTYKLVTKKKR